MAQTCGGHTEKPEWSSAMDNENDRKCQSYQTD